MYQANRILTSLLGRVGWKQPTQTEYAVLTESNTISKSGRYFQDIHAAVSVKSIKEAQEDPDISDPQFNEFLLGMQRGAILKTLSAVFNQDEAVESGPVYERESNVATTFQENSGKFVGYVVEVAENTDYTVALSQIMLLFDKDTSFELKCFTDLSEQAIWTMAIEGRANETTIIDVDDLFLAWMGKYGATNTFYIGYHQADIGEARAINEPVSEWMAGYLWRADAFYATANETKFDLPHTENSLTNGLNLVFTSYKDFTTRILLNKSAFDEAVSLQVACDVLELVLSSTRSNAEQRISQQQLADLFLALNQEQPTGDKPYTPGLKVRYAREIEKLHKAFYGNPKIETHRLPYVVYQGK